MDGENGYQSTSEWGGGGGNEIQIKVCLEREMR